MRDGRTKALLRDSLQDVLPDAVSQRADKIGFAAPELPQLIRDINATGYGLTLGVHSRIDDTIDLVCDTAHVGNIYVNRNIVGAVVGVQPFGGEGLSGTGPKAGGPHYLHRFAEEKSISTDITAAGGNAALMAG